MNQPSLNPVPANDPSKSTERWRQTLLAPTSSVQDAIRNLDASALQIILVAAVDETLVGTLTDGDIRRGLLRGLNLNSPIESIIHREPLVVPPQMPADTVLQLMKSNRFRHLPIVTSGRKVVGLHVWDDLMLPANRSNLMVIMAGGRGTRLKPHTENCPKPLLPVGGKPMLEHIIERAKAEGFRHFVLAVHYLGHMIKDYFGNGDKWGVQIEYLNEDSPLGTAGALGLLERQPDRPFIVSNGDVLTDIRYGDMLDFHSRHGATATMAVRIHEWRHPFGVVRTQGVNIIGFEEKPVSLSHINAGIYVIEPAALEHLVRGEACDMPMLFLRLQQGGAHTIVYPMHEPWLDVGRIDDYNSAQTLV